MSAQLITISSPFTEFGFNFDLNDPAEIAEAGFQFAKKLKHQWTFLNMLRLMILIPEDEMNGRKMWTLLEMFTHQLVTNETTATTKLTFSEFLKEWKVRKEVGVAAMFCFLDEVFNKKLQYRLLATRKSKLFLPSTTPSLSCSLPPRNKMNTQIVRLS